MTRGRSGFRFRSVVTFTVAPLTCGLLVAWPALAQVGAAPIAQPATSSGQTLMPIAIARPLPGAVDAAVTAHATGTIVVEAMVRADGSVRSVRLLDDSTRGQSHGMDAAALAAALKWTFQPIAGVAADVPTPVSIGFKFDFAGSTPADPAQSAVLYEPGFLSPHPVHSVPPRYTEPAMRAKIQGQVLMRVVVDPTGAVSAVTVMRSLDKELGLDDQALAAAKLWTFEPARLNGVPVTSTATIVLTFKLH